MSKAAKIVERTSLLMQARSGRGTNTTAAIDTPTWFAPVVERPPVNQVQNPIRNYEKYQTERKQQTRNTGQLFRTRVKRGFSVNARHLSRLPSLAFPEDKIRCKFYDQHPWERARPRNVVESSGRTMENRDWSTIRQAGLRLSGESVVQRTIWLASQPDYIEKHNKDWYEAYTCARLEFYRLRMCEQAQDEVAAEEAVMNGAAFVPSAIQRGLELEQRVIDDYMVKLPAEIARREAAIPQ